MKSIKYFAGALLFLTISLASFSQTNSSTNDNLSLNNSSISNQFDYVIKKSNGWKNERGQAFRVIKSYWLTELKSHVLDSLKAVHNDLTNTQLTVKKQDKEINDLKSNLSGIQTDLDKTNTEKNNMALFGAQMSKTSYNALMWSIIGGLLILLLFFIFKFKNSNLVTKKAKYALAEIEEEFEEHRKTALEREQKVRRQLQDEINKQKGA